MAAATVEEDSTEPAAAAAVETEPATEPAVAVAAVNMETEPAAAGSKEAAAEATTRQLRQ